MSLIIRSFSFSNRKEQSLNRTTHSDLQLSYAYHSSLSLLDMGIFHYQLTWPENSSKAMMNVFIYRFIFFLIWVHWYTDNIVYACVCYRQKKSSIVG